MRRVRSGASRLSRSRLDLFLWMRGNFGRVIRSWLFDGASEWVDGRRVHQVGFMEKKF